MWSHNNRTINRFSTQRLLEKVSPLLKIPSLAPALSRHLLVASGPTRPLSLVRQQQCQRLTITFNPSLSFTDPLSSFSWSPYGLLLLNHFQFPHVSLLAFGHLGYPGSWVSSWSQLFIVCPRSIGRPSSAPELGPSLAFLNTHSLSWFKMNGTPPSLEEKVRHCGAGIEGSPLSLCHPRHRKSLHDWAMTF